MIKDKDIRYKYILENKENFKQGIFLNEYDINGRNRVDFALLKNGIFTGYEIKSEADNLKRFIPQLRTYLRFFDFMYLIVHKNHVDDVCRILKMYKLNKIGIIRVDDNLSFNEIQKASPNKDINKINSLIKNLKKEDLIDICKERGIIHASLSKEALINKLLGKIKFEEIMAYLIVRLKMNYIKECPCCGSNLTFKTSSIKTKNTFYKEVDIPKKIVSNVNIELKISVKINRCIECLHEFNHHGGTEISRIIKNIVETKL